VLLTVAASPLNVTSDEKLSIPTPLDNVTSPVEESMVALVVLFVPKYKFPSVKVPIHK
jgi:hypothetical protein